MTHLTAALARWKRAEKLAEGLKLMEAWKAEDRAYCEMVQLAYEHGYRPNSHETCAEWVRRTIREAA